MQCRMPPPRGTHGGDRRATGCEPTRLAHARPNSWRIRLRRSVGHVSHGFLADALEQSEASQQRPRDQKRPANHHRQVEPDLRI